MDTESSIVVEIENSVSVPGIGMIHKVRCMKMGQVAWEAFSASKVTACAGNRYVFCIQTHACAYTHVHIHTHTHTHVAF